MARKKKPDTLYHQMFRKHAFNIQYSVLDLGKMEASFEALVANGTDPDSAMQAVVAKYRKN